LPGAAFDKETRQSVSRAEIQELDDLHIALDNAVVAAYGWPLDLTDEQILERLLALNLERAALLQRLRQDNVDQSLAAILTLNTIAHTVGAILSGAKATVVFGSAWFGLFSAIMTLAILFLSEIVPKTIGAIYWARLAGVTALFVNSLILSLYPIVWLSEKLTKFISRGQDVHIFSRTEFLAMARVAEQSGQLSDNESRIIANLFLFESLRVKDIMTPRTVMSTLDEELTIAAAAIYASKNPFSRLPIYKTDTHNITGFALRDDILQKEAEERGHETVATIKRPIHAVPELASLSALLKHFLKNQQHIAIVFDEYGDVSGLVTLEDLLETLMGMEIVDEKDSVVDMRALARKKWAERMKALNMEGMITEEAAAK
jgi:CBS domain containing-hemolysin-like protein